MSGSRDVTVSLGALMTLVGSENHSHEIPGAEMLALACNALDAASDELNIIRHALESDELDATKLDLVLFRLAERMSAAAGLAWSGDDRIAAVRAKAAP